MKTIPGPPRSRQDQSPGGKGPPGAWRDQVSRQKGRPAGRRDPGVKKKVPPDARRALVGTKKGPPPAGRALRLDRVTLGSKEDGGMTASMKRVRAALHKPANASALVIYARLIIEKMKIGRAHV